jgi:predicted Zn-ribbon and HTH transcriptional regulator
LQHSTVDEAIDALDRAFRPTMEILESSGIQLRTLERFLLIGALRHEFRRELLGGGSIKVDVQVCRDCGEPFPYIPEADRCASCVAESLGEPRSLASVWRRAGRLKAQGA